jgi:transposase
MGNNSPQYAPAFREEAVRLVKGSGKPVAAIARDLGVSYETLRKWIE